MQGAILETLDLANILETPLRFQIDRSANLVLTIKGPGNMQVGSTV